MNDHNPFLSTLQALHLTTERQEATLARQADQLGEHMRRTLASEVRVDQVESFVVETRAYMQSLKVLGIVIAGAFGIAATVVAIVALIHSW